MGRLSNRMSFPVTWAPRAVNPSPNCPRGLDSLILTDRIVVKQQVELLEAFTDFETVNRYQVLNEQGQCLFYCVEDSECCERNFCKNLRGLSFVLYDQNQQGGSLCSTFKVHD